MIGITDPKERQAWQQEVERIMSILEVSYSVQWRRALNRQYLDAARLLEHEGIDFINSAVDKWTRRFLKTIKFQYRRTATIFSRKAFKILEETKGLETPYIKTPLDEFWKSMNIWMAQEAGKKIAKVQKTTKKIISKIIKRGMNKGESTTQIAKRIRRTGRITNVFRAESIALTETHTAAVKSMDEVVKASRIEMEREWVSARDKRTRTRSQGSEFEHFATFPKGANRERVKQDEVFHGTGENMKYPGDPAGSAANVVRCRCVLLYHPVKVLRT